MNNLAAPVKERRFNAVIGLSTAEPAEGRVDRTGGKYGAGLIRGVSVLTRGEALGHGFWVDAVMLQQCFQFAKEMADKGLKCRFTHPGLCADGLAKKLGVLMNPRLVGDQVIADLHFNTFAHNGPDGDLASYVMNRADEEPEYFGTSIVFCSDWDAEDLFIDEHQQKVETEDREGRQVERYEFVSPDPDNVENLPHARIAELCACDCVDDPAANPNGFFHKELSTVKEAEGFLEYAFGLSDARPTTVSLGVDPDRARQFLSVWATNRGLSLPSKGNPMFKLFKKKDGLADDPAKPPTETPPETKPGDPPKPDEKKEPTAADTDVTPVSPDADGNVTCPKCGEVFPVAMDDGTDAEPIGDQPQSPADYAAAHAKYTAAFGAEAGTKFFLGKVKFSEAQKQHFAAQLAAKDKEIADLKTQLKSANDRLAFFANSGADPLGASPAPAGTEGGAKGSGGFASLFKIPGQ